MSKKIDSWCCENTFFSVDVQTIFCKDRKNLFQVGKMFLMGIAENEEIVEINEQKRKRSEKRVHEALERLGGVFESKRHETEFEQSKWGDYCRFGDIRGGHRYLVVSLLQIYF